MASSAIPIVFPATALTVDGQPECFGDGSMRQISPLSPAMHLGAHRIMVIGVGTKRSGLGRDARRRNAGLSAVASHAMASVFHDTLQADVEQAQRVTETLKRLPPEVAAVLPYRPVRVFVGATFAIAGRAGAATCRRAAAGDATIAWRPDQRQWWRVVGELPVVSSPVLLMH